jgi:hypothetical protein
VSIFGMFHNSAFEPDDVRRMTEAFELALKAIQLQDRVDPLAEALAKHIISIVQTGEKDPARVSALALERLRDR